MSVLDTLSTSGPVTVSTDATTTPQSASAELLANIARLYRLASLGLAGKAPGLAAHQSARALRLLMVDAYALANAYCDVESFDS